MTAAATPPFPEAALRALLAGTVAAWARALSSAGDEPRGVYVDAFAGAEFAFGTGVRRDAAEPTRAGTALRALDEGCAGLAPPAAAFVEEDPAHLQRVYAELEDTAGGERLRATRDLASLAPGEASLVEADFASVAADVARFAGDGPAFVFLAPAAARALPWTALRALAANPAATLLIRIPHADFEKQSRHTGPLADLPGFARRIVEGCSAMLDDAKHAWLPAWRADQQAGFAAAMEGVLGRFRALLATVAGDRVVEPLILTSDDGAPAYLFLMTPEPAVALAANAAPPEPEPEPAPPPTPPPPPSPAPEPEPEAAPLDLFPETIAPAEPALADLLAARFAGRETTWGEVLSAFSAPPEELKKALAALRRSGRASYKSLRADTDPIDFPIDPILPIRSARKPKPPLPGGLFDDE